METYKNIAAEIAKNASSLFAEREKVQTVYEVAKLNYESAASSYDGVLGKYDASHRVAVLAKAEKDKAQADFDVAPRPCSMPRRKCSRASSGISCCTSRRGSAGSSRGRGTSPRPFLSRGVISRCQNRRFQNLNRTKVNVASTKPQVKRQFVSVFAFSTPEMTPLQVEFA